ncbi:MULTISPECIES: hypothetical protein [unclassified Sphingomonas]|uniref:hypothetical protein n=1 Tax=unclassified Sphingomonas TaxID=196159 RepID=UPI0015CBA0D3|nr:MULTISPECIES: hypothetical protein [unclassified Sphingomonas]
MKAFIAITAAAVSITSPLNVAIAQTSVGQCLEECGDAYYRDMYNCAIRYGSSVEGEYCQYGVGQERDSCVYFCNLEGASLSSEKPRTDRFRPSEINAEHLPAL